MADYLPSDLSGFLTASLLVLAIWAASLVIAGVALRVAVLRMPADYLRRSKAELDVTRSWRGWWRMVGRNMLGGVVLLAGCVLVPAPGPGLAAILAGIWLVDLPCKHRLERWFISRPKVFSALNLLRTSAGRPPLLPADEGPPSKGECAA